MTLFSDFQAQLRRDLEEPTENVWKDASLMYWTNEVARDLAYRVRQNTDEEYRDSVAGTSDYTLPADTQEILAVYYDGLKLLKQPAEAIYDREQSTGTPVYYQRMDEILRLQPTPDTDDLEIRIIRKSVPDAITATTDEMPFRSERNTALEYGVLAKCFEQTNDWQSADAYRQRYEQALSIFEADAAAADSSDGSSFPVETY